MYTTYPAWRTAKEYETPGQLEPQLEHMKIHVIDLETSKSICGKAVFGDKAITEEQARDPNNDMYFDCEDCYIKLTKDKNID